MRIHSESYKKKYHNFCYRLVLWILRQGGGGGTVDNNFMMCVGSVAVIWLVDYWVLYGQPWLMPTHPQRPTHKITALPYQRSSSCCTAKYQDDHFRLTTDQKKSVFQRSTFCGCTDSLLYENFLWLSVGFYPFLHTLLGIRCADGRAQTIPPVCVFCREARWYLWKARVK